MRVVRFRCSEDRFFAGSIFLSESLALRNVDASVLKSVLLYMACIQGGSFDVDLMVIQRIRRQVNTVELLSDFWTAPILDPSIQCNVQSAVMACTFCKRVSNEKLHTKRTGGKWRW